MELSAQMRYGKHGVFGAERQQPRVRSLHLAGELVVLACVGIYTNNTLSCKWDENVQIWMSKTNIR